MASVVTYTTLPTNDALKFVSRGKVRDVYGIRAEDGEECLLFVASDRISAYDVIMKNVSGRIIWISVVHCDT